MAVQSAGKLGKRATIKKREKGVANAKREKLYNQRRETWENKLLPRQRADTKEQTPKKPRQSLVSPDR